MRRAFSLIMAIIFVLVIAVVGTLTLTLTSTGVQQTTGLYLREQADLLATSAIEATIYAIQDTSTLSGNFKNNINLMVEKINNSEDIFNIKVDVRCVPSSIAVDKVDCDGFSNQTNQITSQLQAIIITATVSTDIGGEPIRYVKTTTQKP